jgi:hypothetical protein
MQSEQEGWSELWEEAPHTLPLHSRLYHLTPLGLAHHWWKV